MRKNKLTKSLLLVLGLGCSLSVSARERLDAASQTGGGKSSGGGNRVAAGCLTSSSYASLDINNVRAMVLNGGDMWWDLSSARYEVPKVTDPNLPRRHSIFAGAVWIGGKDAQDNLYTATQTYRQGPPYEQGYWPGPLDNTGNIAANECAAWNYHSKIDKAVVDQFRLDFANGVYADRDADKLPKAIRNWPGKNNPVMEDRTVNMNYELAPFVNVGGSEAYEPFEGDYPDFRGDQSIWWVMNDAGGIKQPLSKRIGLEIQVLAFGFQTNDLINNMTFYKQILKNKGTTELKDTYIGQWVDPDLGFYNDDYVGCDVARGLGICYNGDNDDEGANGYGLNPPAVGVDFFQGPLADANDGIDNNRNGVVDEVGEKIIMSSFLYFNNNSNATNGNPNDTKPSDYYNYLRAVWKDGKNVTYGGDGTDQSKPAYKFMFPGLSDPNGFGFSNPAPAATPIKTWDWSEFNTDGNKASNTPLDRRFLESAGPFTLKPGSVNELTIGVVWARANSGGAQGSLGLLKYADDRAQRLFDNDFKLPQGPDAPLVKASELDQQVVLSLDPSQTFRNSNGDVVTTETYFEKDNSLSDSVKDKVYRFEGYKIYQLKDATVSASEVEDPNRARLLSQADIKNGVTNIITYEYDADLGDLAGKLRVRGNDAGVAHTLNITTDLFATGKDRLVNFKTYHYMVIAYAYNGDPKNHDDKYLEGRRVSIVSAIPHKSQVEQDGTVLSAGYGTAAEITRIFGTGTGGHVLEITPQDENEIVQNFSKKELRYQPGHAPFVVKVYDPKIVKGGNFNIKLSSRLVYDKSIAKGTPQVNDTIVSTGSYTNPATFDANKFANKMTPYPQVAGRAIVKRIIETDKLVNGKNVTYVTLDVEMLNDHLGGTFVAYVDKYNKKVVIGQKDPVIDFDSHIIEPRAFESTTKSFQAVSQEFVLNDFWKYKIMPDGSWTYSDRPISEFNEQLLPEYGIAIEFKHATSPFFQIKNNALNGYLESSIVFSSGAKWFTGVQNNVPDKANMWLLAKSTPAVPSVLSDIDPNYNYLDVLDGTWAPYGITQKITGPAYDGVSPENRKIYDLQNVDIVITSDKSKWTRVPVLQGNSASDKVAATAFKLTKYSSNVPSVGKDGNPDGALSNFPKNSPNPAVSMGWFPGYAVDLDRGIRLNMMFAEYGEDGTSSTDSKDPGRNLLWEPTDSADGGMNFIYVMKTKYDEGKSLSYSLDSAKYTSPLNVAVNYKPFIQKNIFDNVIWTGYPKLAKGAKLLACDVRVRLRVNQYFTSFNPEGVYNVKSNNQRTPYTGFNTNPEYTFSTNNLATQVNQKPVATTALDLIRIVPNPYYAFSQYEQRQLDNIVKITNLPKKCKISIYTINGTLVKTFNKDDSRTFLDWTLKNDNNLPISSGVYIVNVDAGSIGNKVIKWFGIMRPMDMDSF